MYLFIYCKAGLQLSHGALCRLEGRVCVTLSSLSPSSHCFIKALTGHRAVTWAPLSLLLVPQPRAAGKTC